MDFKWGNGIQFRFMRLHGKNATPLPTRTPENLSQYGVGRGGGERRRQRKGGVALFKKPSEPSDYVAMTDSASENGMVRGPKRAAAKR